MPIDYIKLETGSDLRQNSFLAPHGEYDINTGEDVTECLKSTYGGMVVLHKPTKTFIQNSIHKHYQGNNAFDFTFADFVDASITLCKDLDLNPFTTRVRSLEFGYNLVLPKEIPVAKYISHCIALSGKRFSNNDCKRSGARYIHRDYQQYSNKAYNKGVQYYQSPDAANTFRNELHVCKMEFLNDIDIHYLSDLLDPLKAFKLIDKIRQSYEQIIFFDWSINPATLTRSQRRIYTDWKTPLYIETLKGEDKRRFKYEQAIYFEIMEDHRNTSIKSKVWSLAEKKWSALFVMDAEDCTKLTDFLSEYENPNLYQSNHLSIGLNKDNVYCSITGEDITDQKRGSRFISAKKIGYNAAHDLRNMESNPRNNFRAKFIKRLESGNGLFNCNEISIYLTQTEYEYLEYFNNTPLDVLNTHRLHSRVMIRQNAVI
jgi:hypothetical protein